MLLLRLRSRAEPLARRVPQKSTPWVCVSAASSEDRSSVSGIAGVHFEFTPVYFRCQKSAPEWHCSIFFVSSIPSGRKR